MKSKLYYNQISLNCSFYFNELNFNVKSKQIFLNLDFELMFVELKTLC